MESPKQLLAGLVSCFIAAFVTVGITFGFVWLFGGYSLIADNLALVLIAVFLVVWWVLFLLMFKKRQQ